MDSMHSRYLGSNAITAIDYTLYTAMTSIQTLYTIMAPYAVLLLTLRSQ